MSFKIYKGDAVVVEGESPLTITGVAPNTNVASGEYKVTRVDGERESEKVDIPSFKTLPIVVTGVTLSPKTSSAEAGAAESRQISATVSPANATNKSVSYAIAPTTAGLTVSNSGLIAWTAAVPAGTYTTTVTTADGAKKDTHVLTLTVPAVASVSIAPKTATLEIDGTRQLTPTVLPANAGNKTVSYASSASGIATVNASGLVTAIAEGVATITVTTADGNKTDTSVITVNAPVDPEPEPDPEEGE